MTNTLTQPDASLPSTFADGAAYDLLFNGFDYAVAFYVDLARAAAGPVLDVACGTGRILLPLLEAGINADGVDLFEPMLERARTRTAAAGYEPTLLQAPMREFRMPRQYALVIIPFNSFVHNLTQEDQIAALRCCREHLLPGGRLTFDVFFPGPEYHQMEQGEPQLELEIPHPETGLPVRIYDTRRLEPVEQIQHSLNEIQELDAAGNVAVSRRSQTSIRWIYKPEMELLLRVAGFSRWELARAFEGASLSGATEPMLVSAWT